MNKNIQAALFLMKFMALHIVSVIFFDKFVSLLVWTGKNRARIQGFAPNRPQNNSLVRQILFK